MCLFGNIYYVFHLHSLEVLAMADFSCVQKGVRRWKNNIFSVSSAQDVAVSHCHEIHPGYISCICIPRRSITCCGKQSVGFTGFKRLSAFNSDKPVKPNNVWKISGILPLRSLNPPVSVSWHDKMNCSSFFESIQCKRPIIDSDDRTHHE